jgi:hypothetical protein
MTPGTNGTTRYTETRYGYGLSFDDSWAIEQDSVVSGTSVLTITNGVSDLTFTSIPVTENQTAGNALDQVIANLGRMPGMAGLAIVKSSSGDEIRSDGPITASALLGMTVTDKDGNESEVRYYVEARLITNQPAALVIIHSAPADQYADQISARIGVTTTITYATR